MEPANDPRYNFLANPTADELIAQQAKGLITDPTVPLGDFWPENEPVENFLAALDDWRGHSKADRAA